LSPVHTKSAGPRAPLRELFRVARIAALALVPWLLWEVTASAFLGMPPRLAVVWLVAVAAFFAWCNAAPGGWSSARWRATSRVRPVPRRAWPWIALLAPVMSTAALSMWMVLSALGIVGERTLPDPILEYGERPGGAVVLVLLIAGLVPMLEEFAFRGWLQRPLERRHGPPAAIVGTALAFAVAHLEPRGLPIYAAGGVALGYAAWATRSIWSSVALHVAWNAGVLVFGGFFPGFDPAAHGRALAVPAGIAFLACVGVFAWAAPRLRRAGRDRRLVAGEAD